MLVGFKGKTEPCQKVMKIRPDRVMSNVSEENSFGVVMMMMTERREVDKSRVVSVKKKRAAKFSQVCTVLLSTHSNLSPLSCQPNHESLNRES